MIPVLSTFGRFRMSAAGQNPALFQAMRRFDELLREKKLPTKAFGEPENHLENQKGTQSSTIAKVHCAGFMFVFGGVVAIYINIYI